MEFQVKGNLAVWQYEEYTAIVVLGKLPSIEALVLPEGEKEESRVMPQGERQFKAVIYFCPVIDLTICRLGNSESSLFAYGIDRKTVEEVIEKIASPPFVSQLPTHRFAEELHSDVILCGNTYLQIKRISEKLNIPLQNLFGVVCYSNFLKQYKSYTDSDSLNVATRKFGVPLIGLKGLN